MNKELINFLDALKVIFDQVWSNGGLSYNLKEFNIGNIDLQFKEFFSLVNPDEELPELKKSDFRESKDVISKALALTLGSQNQTIAQEIVVLLCDYKDNSEFWCSSIFDANLNETFIVCKRKRTVIFLNIFVQYD